MSGAHILPSSESSMAPQHSRWRSLSPTLRLQGIVDALCRRSSASLHCSHCAHKRPGIIEAKQNTPQAFIIVWPIVY